MVKPDAAVRLLTEQLAAFSEATDYVCGWFDRELKTVFGVDIFAEPFDHARGYRIIETPRAKVLVLRMEDLDRALTPSLREILPSSPTLGMVRANVRAETEEAAIYRGVKERLRLPKAVVEQVYSSRYVQHLYSPDMVERFRARWSQERS
jgi:hypothetical protein